MDPSARQRELERINARLADLAAERQALEAARAGLTNPVPQPATSPPALTQQATPQQKIALFRSLFRGRTDVYPVRWECSPLAELFVRIRKRRSYGDWPHVGTRRWLEPHIFRTRHGDSEA